jgi:transketolase
MITETEIQNLKNLSLSVREHIIKMSTDGGCFIGASLSCVDLIVFLYSKFLNVTKNNMDDPERDYLFLSKGHDVPALYGTFAELGFIEKSRLENHLKTNDYLYWHPNRHIPGVEFHSGSLGHLLPVAVGVAMDCKIKNQNNKVVVIVGDGELNEGSNWESLLIANAYHLDNLMIIVDRNLFQANMQTEELIPLEPLERKFEAFGCSCISVNGHNFDDLNEVLSRFPFDTGRASVVIAETVRGKGLPSIEKRADRWFCNFTKTEVDSLIKELHNEAIAKLTSETMVVR